MREAVSTCLNKIQGRFKDFKSAILDFANLHPDIFCLSILGILCILFLIVGLGFYPLLDVDETRYAIMARDMVKTSNWNDLMLNYAPFLEKPPLYFWFVATSIQLFGKFSSFVVRFPIALLASFITFFTYFVGKKVISRKYGMISALILLSSVFFLILSHVAIIDMVLTVFLTGAIYCGFLTDFVKPKNKKYCWWYFYLFVGAGFLSKGLLAVLPVIVIFAYKLFRKDLKDFFKPLHLLPGIVLFLIVSLPWHIIMYKEYGYQFIFEYFLVHHFARFINSEFIGRERPGWYFIPVFLVGFLPWTLIFIAFIADGFNKLINRFKNAEGKFINKLGALIETHNNEEILLLFASLYFIIVFAFFSSSSTKLPTYILPAFPAAALLTGYFWYARVERGEHQKAIAFSTEIFASIFIIASLGALIAFWFLPPDLQYDLEPMRTITVCGLCLLAILLIVEIKSKKSFALFSSYILTMLFVIAMCISYIFNVIYVGGENEIVEYSRIAQAESGELVTFDFAVKPSSMINYKGYVSYITDPEFGVLDHHLKNKNALIFVIVKNKNLRDPAYKAKISKRLKLMAEGRKYSLYLNR